MDLGEITGLWPWAVAALVGLVILYAVVRLALRAELPEGAVSMEVVAGIKKALPELSKDIEDLRKKATDARNELAALEARLKRNKKLNDQQATFSALAGVILGVAGSFTAEWVLGERTGWPPDDMELVRGLVTVLVCAAIAFALIVPLNNWVANRRFGSE